MEIEIIDQNNKENKNFKINSKIWENKFSPYLISLYNRYSLFNERNVISKTKTKGEVSGGGRKPWRQKGTGRARQGSIRSPQWKGGGVAFGPTGKQNYEIKLNKKVRKNAISSLLSKKLSEGKIVFIEKIFLDSYRTKEALSFLKSIKLGSEKILLVLSYPDEFSIQIRKSFENLKNISLTSSSQINILKILSSNFIVFTKNALIEIEERLSNF